MDKPNTLRPDLALIADQINAGERMLDVGCDDGALLHWLIHNKKVDGRGIELNQAGVNLCVAKGLFVIQGDAEKDLSDYPDDSFDVVVLSKTLQATNRPREVLHALLRVGKRAIVSIPNFGYWKVRYKLLATGKMPVTRSLHSTWYDTSNIHFCTILDLVELIEAEGLKLRKFIPNDSFGKPLRCGLQSANWRANQALFVIEKKL